MMGHGVWGQTLFFVFNGCTMGRWLNPCELSLPTLRDLAVSLGLGRRESVTNLTRRIDCALLKDPN